MEQAPEFFCKDDHQQAGYTDKPAPGRGVLLLFHLSCAGPLLIMVFVFGSIEEADSVDWLVLATVIAILVLIYSFSLHAAYGTVYSIEGGVLKMRGGFIKGTVKLATVRAIKKTGSVTTVLGWGFGSRAICNRFSDIVALETGKGEIYISPSDPDLFIERLRGLMPDSVSAGPPGTGEGR